MSKETMQLALEEFKHIKQWCLRSLGIGLVNENVLAALEEALAKQENGEPDKYVMDIECTKCGAKQSGILTVNTTPQPAQKPWVGINDEEIRQADHRMVEGAYHHSFKQGVRWAEDKLKERNT
jgi:hypothetical protein